MVIHTRNRPEFLLRAIEYYTAKISSAAAIDVVILDASDDEKFAILSEALCKNGDSPAIRLMHHSSTTALCDRIAEALTSISTPYVLLAADDDLYRLDWLKPAVDLLERDRSYGVVYGHTMTFELDSFQPYGELVKFGFSMPNPPARWLEGSTPGERLAELGRSDWTTIGWYALQRTELLSIIVDSARKHGLDGYHFEKILVFCQSALAKTRMLDEVYLARQINNDERRRPNSFRSERHALEKLFAASASVLSKHGGVDDEPSVRMVESAFRLEIEQLKRIDSRRYLRAVADAFPLIRELRNRLRGRVGRGRSGTSPLAPDSRFPATPEIGRDHPLVKELIDAVSGRARDLAPSRTGSSKRS